MKGMVLAVWIWMSLLFAVTAIGQPWATRPLAPARTSGLAGQVAIVTAERVVTPRSSRTGRRDCVGFPRSRTLVSDSRLGAPLSLVTAGMPHWV